MGQDISKSYLPPPVSLRNCYVDDEIDFVQYQLFCQRTYKNNFIDIEAMMKKNKKRKLKDKLNAQTRKPRAPRSAKRHHNQVRCEDGTLWNATFEDSNWYALHIDNPPTSHWLLKKFQNRFHLPYPQFLELVEDIKDHELFDRWKFHDCTGSPPSDIHLLLLG
jgi:hypothetical protein